MKIASIPSLITTSFPVATSATLLTLTGGGGGAALERKGNFRNKFGLPNFGLVLSRDLLNVFKLYDYAGGGFQKNVLLKESENFEIILVCQILV
jgi:hypothetical protein